MKKYNSFGAGLILFGVFSFIPSLFSFPLFLGFLFILIGVFGAGKMANFDGYFPEFAWGFRKGLLHTLFKESHLY